MNIFYAINVELNIRCLRNWGY